MDNTSPYQDPGKVILIDKPLQWTSFDAVKKIRNTIKIKKVGHAGTLDPLATGLLIICTGKKTKQIEGIQAKEKEYTCTFVLGKTTESFDLERPVIDSGTCDHITDDLLKKMVIKFTGEQSQIPPAHSAVKIDGERAYKKARAGETVILSPKNISIYDLELLSAHLPEISLRIVCSKGTYIRSLARDMGEYLTCGAYMKDLRRTRIGDYRVEDALTIEEFIKNHADL